MDGGGEPEVGDCAPEPDEAALPVPPEPEVQTQAQEPLLLPLPSFLGAGKEPSATEDGHDDEAVRERRAELAEVYRLGRGRRREAQRAGVGAGEHEGLETGRVDEGRVHGDGDGRRGAGSVAGGPRAGGAPWGRGEEGQGGEARDLGGHGDGPVARRTDEWWRARAGAAVRTITGWQYSALKNKDIDAVRLVG